MSGELNMAQITLACGLLLEQWYPGLEWREGHSSLAAFADRHAARPSFTATRPDGTLKT